VGQPVELTLRQRAEAFEGLSTEAYAQGRADLALGARQSAIELRRELGDLRGVGANLRWLSRLYWWHGRRHDAEEAAAEAVAVLQPLGPSRELAMAYSNQSQLLMLAEQNHQAIRAGEQAIVLALELDDTETLVHAQTNVGTARMDEDPDAGRAMLAEAGRLALDAHLDEHGCRAFHNVASVDHDNRRFALAAVEVARAIDVARQMEHPWFEADTLILGASLDVNLGRWERAVSTVEDLLDAGPLPGVSAVVAAGCWPLWSCAAAVPRRSGWWTRRGSWPSQPASCNGLLQRHVCGPRRRGSSVTLAVWTRPPRSPTPQPCATATSGTSVSWRCGAGGLASSTRCRHGAPPVCAVDRRGRRGRCPGLGRSRGAVRAL
jgi:tetratricopeptide (TPR) repeat protein